MGGGKLRHGRLFPGLGVLQILYSILPAFIFSRTRLRPPFKPYKLPLKYRFELVLGLREFPLPLRLLIDIRRIITRIFGDFPSIEIDNAFTYGVKKISVVCNEGKSGFSFPP